MQHVKDYLLLKYKEHPVLYPVILAFFFLLKDLVIEIYHKAIAPLVVWILNVIAKYFCASLEWLSASHSFSGYLLTSCLACTVCVIGGLYFLFRRSKRQLNIIQAELYQKNKALEAENTPYNSDTIKGIRWRWDNGWGTHDIYNLSPYCPDEACDGELKPTPFTKQYPAKVIHICDHCEKRVHSLRYNLNLHHYTEAAELFYDDIKTEIRRRKRLKSNETHSNASP